MNARLLPNPLHNLLLATDADPRKYATILGLSLQTQISCDDVRTHIANNSDMFDIQENGHALSRIRLSHVGVAVAESLKFLLAMGEDARGYVTILGLSLHFHVTQDTVRTHIAKNPAIFTAERGATLTRCRLSVIGKKMLDSIKQRFCRTTSQGEETETRTGE